MESMVPPEFYLGQNYPNPFSRKTTIKFCLPRRGPVTIDICNCESGIIRRLLDGKRDAGTYEVELDGAGLPEGSYICILQAGEFMTTKRMVLTRGRLLVHLLVVLTVSFMMAAPGFTYVGAETGAAAEQFGTRPGGDGSDDVIPGVVVIKFNRPVTSGNSSVIQRTGSAWRAASACGVTSLARAFPAAACLTNAEAAAGKVDLSRIHVGTIPVDMDPRAAAAMLAAMPEVEYAEPKYNYHPCEIPNDSDYLGGLQVYLDRMNVAAGWTLRKGNPDVVIAAVDGGTNWRHPDLARNMWVNPLEDLNRDGIFTTADLNGVDDDGNGMKDDVVGWNFGNHTNDPRGFLKVNADHGTETASAFGAVTNNASGMAGTSWNCRVMAVCASDPKRDTSFLYGFDGIEYAYRMGARVINCSWTRAGGPENFSRMEQEVITAATQAGALVVAAAGNKSKDLDRTPWYPAAYDHVLSVGATEDTSDRLAYFTNYGLNVSVFAPGMRIRVAKDCGSYGTDQGTSHASPLVAGLAGLLFVAHPDWTPDQVAEQIRMTADPIDLCNPSVAGSVGHGRVNFARALSEVHAGVRIVAGTFGPISDRPFLLEGDTAVLAVKVKNVLTIPAENLTFTVSSDPTLKLIGSIPSAGRLDAGQEDSLSWYFVVGHVTENRDLLVRCSWSANTDEHGGRRFGTTVYAGTGFWVRQQSPTASRLLSVHTVNDRVAWAVGYEGYNLRGSPTVLRTTDGGSLWAIATGNLPGIATVSISAVDSMHAWVSGTEGKIFATTNGGASWTQQDYPAPRSGLIKGFWFFDAMEGYAWGEPETYGRGNPGRPGRSVLLRTTNGGATWAHVPNEPMSVTGNLGINAFCCKDRQHIWFGAPDAAVWRSTDGGDSWSAVRVGKSEVTALAMRDDSVGIVCLGRGADFEPPSIARTTDGGATWQQLPGVKPDGGDAASFPAGSTEAWVAGAQTVLCSRDGGMNWITQPAQHFSCNVTAMSFSDPATGWMVTEAGDILRYQRHEVTIADPVTAIDPGPHEAPPARAGLAQNYPNPFNGRTVVSSQLSVASHVKLVVYDLLGREVAVLVDERRAAGSYRDTFDASGLASGVYIYCLTAGSRAQSRAMILLK